jgi:hypothetical protein
MTATGYVISIKYRKTKINLERLPITIGKIVLWIVWVESIKFSLGSEWADKKTPNFEVPKILEGQNQQHLNAARHAFVCIACIKKG